MLDIKEKAIKEKYKNDDNPILNLCINDIEENDNKIPDRGVVSIT